METKFATINETYIGRNRIDGKLIFIVNIFTDSYQTSIIWDFSPDVESNIAKLLDTVGVTKWEWLRGHRIKIKDNGFGSDIIAICNQRGDAWFYLKEVDEK